ncbi:MAG: tRNA uridine-5-carboxymethylaminomethyl(34) synthesis enzyme MnmG, partial [Clostridia bacterium]|nr:tRNA uridine-5-carboxymethylaminomethyl(34) synthesis enzyme MnmG [Clostridia bacterium]
TGPQECCDLTYTNGKTHELILANLHRSPMYAGTISATGTRYCPYIEDKIVRFADKERHQLIIEPEGRTTDEMYVQGMSTSLPRDVQEAMLRSIEGMERCRIMRYGYAIEYDCIDPTELDATLMSRRIGGLYFAGQINGSSGYEEAAAQGLYAGVNAALYVKGEEPLMLLRSDAYIGVLCDDLTVKGTNEPYRMMTSRAEYRLMLRQDNADLRLTELARRTGLISDARYARLMKKREDIERANSALSASVHPDEALIRLLEERGAGGVSGGVRLDSLLKRGGIGYTDLAALYDLPDIGAEAAEEIDVNAHYAGYIDKQRAAIERFAELEELSLPENMDYGAINGLRIEARQKLGAQRPRNIGQASRISGVSPADIAVLIVKLKAMGATENER